MAARPRSRKRRRGQALLQPPPLPPALLRPLLRGQALKQAPRHRQALQALDLQALDLLVLVPVRDLAPGQGKAQVQDMAKGQVRETEQDMALGRKARALGQGQGKAQVHTARVPVRARARATEQVRGRELLREVAREWW